MKHVIALLSFSAAAWAGPLASANYDIPVSVADSGGRRSTSSTYRNDGSLGAASGISAVATTVAKHGYVGQLDVGGGHALEGAVRSTDRGEQGLVERRST